MIEVDHWRRGDEDAVQPAVIVSLVLAGLMAGAVPAAAT